MDVMIGSLVIAGIGIAFSLGYIIGLDKKQVRRINQVKLIRDKVYKL